MGVPDELLKSDGAVGAMAKLMNSKDQDSKINRCLLITNLPAEYQESVIFRIVLLMNRS